MAQAQTDAGVAGIAGGTSSGAAAVVDPSYAAHILLAALRPDLVDELLTSSGSPDAIREAQTALACRIMG